MTDEERKKAIEELANSIVNNMSMAEMMAVIVEKAKYLAEQKINKTYPPLRKIVKKRRSQKKSTPMKEFSPFREEIEEVEEEVKIEPSVELKLKKFTEQVEHPKAEDLRTPDWRKKNFRKKIRDLWRERGILWEKIKSVFSGFFSPKWAKLKKFFSKRHKNFKTK